MSQMQNYLVRGMTCGHCVGAVTGELEGIDTVTAVTVDVVPEGDSGRAARRSSLLERIFTQPTPNPQPQRGRLEETVHAGIPRTGFGDAEFVKGDESIGC